MGRSYQQMSQRERVEIAIGRRIGARTIDELWRAVDNICDLSTPHECQNYFHAASYGLS